jgi:hypothetical protein
MSAPASLHRGALLIYVSIVPVPVAHGARQGCRTVPPPAPGSVAGQPFPPAFRARQKGMTVMSKGDFLRQGGTPFDAFLYAAVGEDRGGHTVGVLSTLARLGLDPWEEAAELADLPRVDAQSRLNRLLARFGDVPALREEHVPVILRLVAFLPQASGRLGGQGKTLPSASGVLGAVPMIVALMVILFLILSILSGAAGPEY